jgi:hypothetical protein
MSVASWKVDDDDLGSDHQCITIECNFNNKQQRNFKTVLNLNDVIEDLNMLNFESLDSMDTLIDSIKEKINDNKKKMLKTHLFPNHGGMIISKKLKIQK